MLVATKNLPAQLKSLVRSTLNVNVASVVLHAGPAEIWTSWRTGKIESLGKVLKTVSESHRGCDGESNDSTVTSYTLPVAVAVPKCGRRTKNMVTLHIGNLGALAQIDRAELDAADMVVLLDASLAGEAKPEQVKMECDLVPDWEGTPNQIVRFTGRDSGKHTLWLNESNSDRVLAHWVGYCDRAAHGSPDDTVPTTVAAAPAARPVLAVVPVKSSQEELMEWLGVN